MGPQPAAPLPSLAKSTVLSPHAGDAPADERPSQPASQRANEVAESRVWSWPETALLTVCSSPNSQSSSLPIGQVTGALTNISSRTNQAE